MKLFAFTRSLCFPLLVPFDRSVAHLQYRKAKFKRGFIVPPRGTEEHRIATKAAIVLQRAWQWFKARKELARKTEERRYDEIRRKKEARRKKKLAAKQKRQAAATRLTQGGIRKGKGSIMLPSINGAGSETDKGSGDGGDSETPVVSARSELRKPAKHDLTLVKGLMAIDSIKGLPKATKTRAGWKAPPRRALPGRSSVSSGRIGRGGKQERSKVTGKRSSSVQPQEPPTPKTPNALDPAKMAWSTMSPGFKVYNFDVIRVDEENRDWEVPWLTYEPTEYTAQEVLNDTTKRADHIIHHARKFKFNALDGDVDRRSVEGKYLMTEGDIGRPLNPRGRTGVSGRGLLWRWGPNPGGDVIISRWKRRSGNLIRDAFEEPIVEVLMIKNGATDEMHLPGGLFVGRQNNEEFVAAEFAKALSETKVTKQVKIEEKKSMKALLETAKILFDGILNDPRNTDNAWVECTVTHYHDKEGNMTELLSSRGSSGQGNESKLQAHSEWVEIQPGVVLYAPQEKYILQIREKLISQTGSALARKRKAKNLKKWQNTRMYLMQHRKLQILAAANPKNLVLQCAAMPEHFQKSNRDHIMRCITSAISNPAQQYGIELEEEHDYDVLHKFLRAVYGKKPTEHPVKTASQQTVCKEPHGSDEDKGAIAAAYTDSEVPRNPGSSETGQDVGSSKVGATEAGEIPLESQTEDQTRKPAVTAQNALIDHGVVGTSEGSKETGSGEDVKNGLIDNDVRLGTGEVVVEDLSSLSTDVLNDLELSPLVFRVEHHRNVAGLPFTKAMNESQKIAAERFYMSVFQTFAGKEGCRGVYYSFSPSKDSTGIQQPPIEVLNQLKDSDLYFQYTAKTSPNVLEASKAEVLLHKSGEFRREKEEWRVGKGIYVGDNAEFVVHVGGKDHFVIIVQEKLRSVKDPFLRGSVATESLTNAMCEVEGQAKKSIVEVVAKLGDWHSHQYAGRKGGSKLPASVSAIAPRSGRAGEQAGGPGGSMGRASRMLKSRGVNAEIKPGPSGKKPKGLLGGGWSYRTGIGYLTADPFYAGCGLRATAAVVFKASKTPDQVEALCRKCHLRVEHARLKVKEAHSRAVAVQVDLEMGQNTEAVPIMAALHSGLTGLKKLGVIGHTKGRPRRATLITPRPTGVKHHGGGKETNEKPQHRGGKEGPKSRAAGRARIVPKR